MLGEFSVRCGDQVYNHQTDRSRKGKSLLAYLIFHRDRTVSYDELIRVLGSDVKDDAPLTALRTTMHRLRKVIQPIEEAAGCPFIINQNGAYGWNPEVPLELDIARFSELCRAEIPDTPEGAKLWRALLDLYGGDFLQNLASEDWVERYAEYFRELYVSAAERGVSVIAAAGMVDEAIRHCQNAIRFSPYSETLYCQLMQIRASQGDNEGAASSYEEFRARLYKDLGVEPSEETQRVYQSILSSMGRNVLAVETIIGELQEPGGKSGPLFCDYSTFVLFYQAEARSAARRGDAIHIGVFTVLGRGGKPVTTRSLGNAMRFLKENISRCLRTGDIVSSCSPCQYVVMLLQANYENSGMVCDRILKAFEQEHPRLPVLIKTDVFPLTPRGIAAPPQGGEALAR